MRVSLILAAVAALLVPVGSAAAAEPTYADTFKRVCIDAASSFEAQAAAARQAGFTDVEMPKPEGLEKSAGLTRGSGDQALLMVLGAATTPARGAFPMQSGLTCLIGGNAAADLAGVERWIGLKPYSEENGLKMYAFEIVNGRLVGFNGEDAVAVTAALGRKGYYLVMVGESGGMNMAVAAYSRSPGKP